MGGRSSLGLTRSIIVEVVLDRSNGVIVGLRIRPWRMTKHLPLSQQKPVTHPRIRLTRCARSIRSAESRIAHMPIRHQRLLRVSQLIPRLSALMEWPARTISVSRGILLQQRSSSTSNSKTANTDPIAQIPTVYSNIPKLPLAVMVPTAPSQDASSTTARLPASLILAQILGAFTSTPMVRNKMQQHRTFGPPRTVMPRSILVRGSSSRTRTKRRLLSRRLKASRHPPAPWLLELANNAWG
jgi:hypothetical protein